jgi:hypothetical protein
VGRGRCRDVSSPLDHTAAVHSVRRTCGCCAPATPTRWPVKCQVTGVVGCCWAAPRPAAGDWGNPRWYRAFSCKRDSPVRVAV